MRIAVIKVAALGDVVRTTAILPGLRRRYPDMQLVWITAREALDLVRYHPDVDEAVAIEDVAGHELDGTTFDWVISLDDELASCQLASRMHTAKLSGAYVTANGERRYTPDTAPWFGLGLLRPPEEGGIPLANRLKRENESSHAAILYRMLGLPGPIARPTVVAPRELCERSARWWRERDLQSSPVVIGLNTGAGGRWQFKRWGEEQTATLAAALHDRFEAAVLVLGGPAERPRNRRIVQAAARRRVIETPTDWTLLDFADLIRRCDVVVTSDSLALHLAVAAGICVVGFFGPTSAAEIELYGQGEKVVAPVSCRCCYRTGCAEVPNCMEAISVEMMLHATSRWLPVASRAR